MKRFALAAMLSVAAILPAAAQETVDWMHISSIPEEVALMEAAVAEYEAANPDVKINMQFLENEAFKAKLTTLLQSDAAPDIFYSWGGGVLTEQAAAGVLRPVEDLVDPAVAEAIGSGGMSAFTRDGHVYGLAQQVSEVVLWYNKALFEQAGVDPASLETWDGFLAAVQTFKDAGITPLAVGAKDKWPAHFWWSKLVVRLAGQDAFDAARMGENGGFAAEPFVKAGEMFLQLAELEPFQEGFLAASYGDASGYFGDGKAAMHLMGDWDYGAMKDNSANKLGIPDDQLGFLPFPTIEGGAGDPTDTLGGINGWLFHKNAPDAAVDFVEWYTSAEVASRFGNAGFFIPIAKGAADGMTNPFKVQIAQSINAAHWHSIFFDQELGPQIGGVVNDISAELAGNALSAEEAAELVEEAAADLR
ncbi:ABC transporter substrate-binding protein [Devosia sp. SL43]|uniref:ABC transporter substrate-binding protein n=1 Tax=Devosia sp. SL43 TaxID=2806348 RepID=UPI001F4443D0|nr:extracellular solute-binding protein [Devosia sp. SL43]UJW84736.1 extracellular solute-binding protein [Devosia sp. SL43]